MFTRNHRVRRTNLPELEAYLQSEGIPYEVHEPRMSSHEWLEWREWSYYSASGNAPSRSHMASVHCNLSSGEFSRALSAALGVSYERQWYGSPGRTYWSYL